VDWLCPGHRVKCDPRVDPTLHWPRFESIELLHLQPGWVFPQQQYHDWHELVCVVRGFYRVDTPSGRLSGSDGTAIYIPRGIHHHPWMRMGGDRRFFLLRWKEGRHPVLGSEPRKTTDVSGRLRMLLHWMWEVFPGSEEDRPLFQSLLVALLHEFQAHRPRVVPQALRRVLQHMRANLDQPLRLKDLASVAGTSAYHFARQFRAETGLTPMKALAGMRIEAAQSLLRDTDSPLKLVATRVGIANEQHLCRLVRRRVGMAPGEWRRALRAEKMPPAPPAKKKF
jgi:AraC-like DNA-binding protein